MKWIGTLGLLIGGLVLAFVPGPWRWSGLAFFTFEIVFDVRKYLLSRRKLDADLNAVDAFERVRQKHIEEGLKEREEKRRAREEKKKKKEP